MAGCPVYMFHRSGDLLFFFYILGMSLYRKRALPGTIMKVEKYTPVLGGKGTLPRGHAIHKSMI